MMYKSDKNKIAPDLGREMVSGSGDASLASNFPVLPNHFFFRLGPNYPSVVHGPVTSISSESLLKIQIIGHQNTGLTTSLGN